MTLTNSVGISEDTLGYLEVATYLLTYIIGVIFVHVERNLILTCRLQYTYE